MEGLDIDGKKYALEGSETDFLFKSEKLFVYDCDIIHPEIPESPLDKTFLGSVSDIITKAEMPAPTFTKTYSQSPTLPAAVVDLKKDVPVITNPRKTNFAPIITKSSDIAKDISKTIDVNDLPELDFDDDGNDLLDKESYLLMYTLVGHTEYAELDMAYEEILAVGIDASQVAQNFIEIYPACYDRFFEESDDFVGTTEYIIQTLEDSEPEYSFLSNTIMALKYMLQKFEEHGANATV